jgi:hypothetical protein
MAIHDNPRDIDVEWSVPAPRNMARERLEQLVKDPEAAQAVWNAYVAPLYDALRTRQVYSPKMRCRMCGRPHPAGPWSQLKGKPVPDHSMWCPHYVGPVEHRPGQVRKTVDGFIRLCTCGSSYPLGEDSECPKAHMDWKGPR